MSVKEYGAYFVLSIQNLLLQFQLFSVPFAFFVFFCLFVLFCFVFYLQFYFIFKLYIIVLVLPNIKMNPPQVYTCSPSWTLLPSSLSFLKLDLNGVWIHRAGKGIKELLNIWKAPRTKCFLILPLFFPPSCW